MSLVGIDVAVSAQTQLRHRLELISHNVANSMTAGFQERLSLPVEETVTQIGGHEYSFVKDSYTMRNTSLGAFKRTDDPLHVYLNGKGYFSVQTPDGVAYTRNGAFTRNDAGQIVTLQGYPVLNTNNAAIDLPEGIPNLYVAKDGTISDGNTVIGQLGVFTFADDQLMRQVSDTLFETDQAPAPALETQVIQHGYENSNVNAVTSMTDMMHVLNTYKQIQQWVEGALKLNSSEVQNLVKIPPLA